MSFKPSSRNRIECCVALAALLLASAPLFAQEPAAQDPAQASQPAQPESAAQSPAQVEPKPLPPPDAKGFVQVDGTGFVLDGEPFRVAGVNNHYLTFGSDQEVRAVLDDAVAMNANVVRTFLQPVIGSTDGSKTTVFDWKSPAESSNLGTRRIHMMRWDPVADKMEFNDGPDGIQRVDFLLAEARRRNLKLILAFVDFWAYTGGAQQMSAWYGSSDKYTFFGEDPRTRQNYRDWVAHVLSRTNPLTGIRYADDTTIFAWDLANEPDIHPAPLLRDWLTEMSGYVKSLTPRHLVTSGHANMVQKLTDMAIPTIDFGTWHGYASYAKLSHEEFNDLVRSNCELAYTYNKPVLLEEFGVPRNDPGQANAYRTWLDTIEAEGCAGWVVWRLTSHQDSGNYPVDEYDRFDVHNDGSETWNVLKDAAARIQGIPGE